MASLRRSISDGDKIAFPLVILAILVCLFGGLSAIGFVGPDEPRYAWIAREMAASGDWVTPRLYGQPWFEKPALYYWLAAIGFRFSNVPEIAGRWPSAFAAFLAFAGIGWSGLRHYVPGEKRTDHPGFIGALLFATCVGVIGFARSAGPDMLFSGALTWAMVSAAGALGRAGALRVARGGKSLLGDAGGPAFFGIWLGLAVLAKGPAGIALAGGAIGLWAFATKQWRSAFLLADPIAVAAFCIVALPWYVLCALRNPGFVRVFILEHNLERYVTPVFPHRQPIWFFIPILLLALLPWTPFLWRMTEEGVRAWREKSWENSPGFFFACWAAFPVLFFSFSQSKLPGYILPSIPPCALLLGMAVGRMMQARVSQARLHLSVLGATWIGLGLSVTYWIRRLPEPAREMVHVAMTYGGAAAIVGGVVIILLGWRQSRWAIWFSVLFIVLLVLTANEFVLPNLDGFLSARATAKRVAVAEKPSEKVYTFRLQRSWELGMNFYLQQELKEWDLENSGPALLITNSAGLHELASAGRVVQVLDQRTPGAVLVRVEPKLR